MTLNFTEVTFPQKKYKRNLMYAYNSLVCTAKVARLYTKLTSLFPKNCDITETCESYTLFASLSLEKPVL